MIKNINKKSNYISDYFTLTGSIRYANVRKFNRIKSLINIKTKYFEVPFENAIDIDDLHDFHL